MKKSERKRPWVSPFLWRRLRGCKHQSNVIQEIEFRDGYTEQERVETKKLAAWKKTVTLVTKHLTISLDEGAAVEAKNYLVGLQWWSNDIGIQAQYSTWRDVVLAGPLAAPIAVDDPTTWYAMAVWKADGRTNITLRYDDYDARDDLTGDKLSCGDAWTFAVNRSAGSGLFQFEWISIKDDDDVDAGDPYDDQWQIRYKIVF